MNKKNNGFTLIELLAVIIILGILFGIAVPSISKYVNTSRKSVYIDNMMVYLEATKKGISLGDYPKPINNNDAVAISFSAIIENIDHGGQTSPFGGNYIDDNPNAEYCYVIVVNIGTKETPRYKYYISAIDSEGYGLAYPDDLSNTIVTADDLSGDKVVRLESGVSIDSDFDGFNVGSKVTDSGSVLYSAFTVGTPVTGIDGSKWHVFKNSAEVEPTVTLLSDYNITTSGYFNSSCGANLTLSYADSSYNYLCSPVLYYNYDGSSNVSSMLNTFSNNIRSSLPGTTNITLPTAEEIISITGVYPTYSYYYIGSSLYNWLLTTNYWTLNTNGSYTSSIYTINGYNRYLSYSYNYYGSDTYGVRPVITTLKSNLIDK